LPYPEKEITEPVGQLKILYDRIYPLSNSKLFARKTLSKYISWKYPDQCFRVVAVDTEKVLHVQESTHDGPITCACVSDDYKILVTGGADSVVFAHKLVEDSSGVPRIKTIKGLCEHEGAITCICISRPYSIILTGSEDRTCIIWDLNRVKYVRTLGHSLFDQPVTKAAINDVTGYIATCCGMIVSVWNINGDLLLTRNCLVQITSCLFPAIPEWVDTTSFLITGHRDGDIKIWERKIDVVNDPVNHAQTRTKNSLYLTRVLQAHQSSVLAITLSGDNKRLFSGDQRGKVYMWSSESPVEEGQNPLFAKITFHKTMLSG